MSSVLLPLLSGFPAIFQVFFAVATSFPHTGHLAMIIPCQSLHTIYIKHFPLQPQHEPLWTAAIGVLRRFPGIHDEFREDFVQARALDVGQCSDEIEDDSLDFSQVSVLCQIV